jgi:hypothetical protein
MNCTETQVICSMSMYILNLKQREEQNQHKVLENLNTCEFFIRNRQEIIDESHLCNNYVYLFKNGYVCSKI